MVNKNYQEMNSNEQLHFIKEFQTFIDEKMPVLVALTKNRQAWSVENRRDMEQGLHLLGAFPFAEKFVTDALRYGDFTARASRLPIYIQKAKEVLAQTLNVTQRGGQRFALIDPTVPIRRRGRPSREELAARKKGEAVATDDPGLELQHRVASMLGLSVVVTDNAPRELNNDELAAIRQKKQDEYNRQNPSLFQQPVPSAAVSQQPGQQPEHPAVSPQQQPPTIPPTIESLSETRLHLDQVRFLLTPELQQRVDTVRELRNKASVAAETAKAMALKGEKPEAVEPYAKQAAEATEQYEQIYDAVDNELGTVHYRLLNDGDYKEKFAQRFHVKDFTTILKQLKPYYEKVKSPEFELRMKALIEQESPEYVARMKAEKEKKDEVEGILRYLRRKDKPQSDARVRGAEDKYRRLAELLGAEGAIAYRPLVDFIIVENAKLHEAEEQKPDTKNQKPESKTSNQESNTARKKENNQPTKQGKKSVADKQSKTKKK